MAGPAQKLGGVWAGPSFLLCGGLSRCDALVCVVQYWF